MDSHRVSIWIARRLSSRFFFLNRQYRWFLNHSNLLLNHNFFFFFFFFFLFFLVQQRIQRARRFHLHRVMERFNFSELHRKRISLPRLGPVVILLLHRQTVAILIVYGGVVRGFKKWRFVRRRRFLSVRQVQIRRASIRQRV